MFTLMSLKDITHGYETPTSLKNEYNKFSTLFDKRIEVNKNIESKTEIFFFIIVLHSYL